MSPTLVVVGSGAGIGSSTAALFAARKFNKVALISRSSTRLQDDRQTILDSLPTARKVEVKTWSVDIAETQKFETVLREIQLFGDVSCVLFNAARVEPSELFDFAEKEIVKDFMTTNIALYTTAKWALPILQQTADTPSFLVTSSFLWEDPIPMLFSLSMVKASQRNLVQSLQKMNPGVHIAMLNVGGPVSPEDAYLNPSAIAKKFWDLYSQAKESWTFDMSVVGSG